MLMRSTFWFSVDSTLYLVHSFQWKNGSCLLNAYEFPGTDYCGRRFANSEDLLVHVKTHTNPSTSDPRALSMLNVSAPASVAEQAAAASVSATTSSMSTMPSPSPRFHPYGRPPPPPQSASTPPTTPLPPSLAALASNPYASLYTSLFARPPLL